MARHESDREDLWAEAVALVSRAELRLAGRTEPLLVGRRQNGWWSIYFGQDVMLQFTADGQLRRAFRDGNLYRTQGETLARLTRERTATETILLRHDLTVEELAEFQSWMHAMLNELHMALAANAVELHRLTLDESTPIDEVGQQRFLDEADRMMRTVLSTEKFLAPEIRGKP